MEPESARVMAGARGGPPLARPATPPSSLAAPLPAQISYTEPALTGGLGRGVLGSALWCPQLLLQLCRDARLLPPPPPPPQFGEGDVT